MMFCIFPTDRIADINKYPIDRGDIHTAIARKFASSKFTKLASAGEHDQDEDYHPCKH